MARRPGGKKTKGPTKPHGTPTSSRTPSVTWTTTATALNSGDGGGPPGRNRANKSRPGSRGSGGRRLMTQSLSSGMLSTTTHGRHRETRCSLISTHGHRQNRPLLALHVSFFCSFFVAAMLRVVARYRRWVVRETVEKPRAAFLIQTVWRHRQQRRRMQLEASVQVLIPFLRRKLRRIRVAKEKAALLLQRVFRSQKERHFVHWLYQQMRFNRALCVVRQFLERYVAKRYVSFLALQRDERVICEERCAMASLCIIRSEREELLKISNLMNKTAPQTFTPFVTKAMIEEETIRCTRYCPCPLSSSSSHSWKGAAETEETTFSPFSKLTWCEYGFQLGEKEVDSPLRTHAKVTNNNSITCGKKSGVIKCSYGEDNMQSWTSLLHGEEGTRQLILELFQRKSAPYSLVARKSSGESGVSKEYGTIAEKKEFGIHNSNFLEKPSETLCTLDDVISTEEKEFYKQEKDVNANQGTSVVGVSHDKKKRISGNQLIGAFIELLIRAESTERKALESELQSRYKEMMGKINRYLITVKAAHVAPLMYAPLLSSMEDAWLVRRAEQLFCEEYEGRLKLLEEYRAMPLRFLNRPLFNLAAEERRQQLKERLQVMQSTDEMDKGMRNLFPLAPSPVFGGSAALYEEGGQNKIQHFEDLSSPFMHAGQNPFAESSALKSKCSSSPSFFSQLSRTPPPPPPRKAHEAAPAISFVSVHASGVRSQKRNQKQGGNQTEAKLKAEAPVLPSAALAGLASFHNQPNVVSSFRHAPAACRYSGPQESAPLRTLATVPSSLGRLPGILPPLTFPQTHNNSSSRGNNVKISNSLTEVTVSQSTQCNQISSPSVDSDNLTPSRLKALASAHTEHANGCADLLTTQKSFGNWSSVATSSVAPRGAPIPLLRSSRPERGNLFICSRPSRLSEDNSVVRGVGGADYVRKRYRCSSPNAPSTVIVSVDGSPRISQPHTGKEQISSFKLHREHSLPLRRMKRKMHEFPSLSF